MVEEALGHSYDEGVVTTAATCTTAGVKTFTCGACGNKTTQNIQALGHTTDSGVCDNCGETIGEDDVVVYEDKTYSYTFVKGVYAANGTKNLGGVDWTLADCTYFGWDSNNGKGFQFGSSSNPAKNFTITSAEFTNVKEITINTSGASSINGSFTVWVNGVQVGSSTKLTTSAASYTFTLEEPVTGTVQIKYTQTSSKAIYIKSITVEYQEEVK